MNHFATWRCRPFKCTMRGLKSPTRQAAQPVAPCKTTLTWMARTSLTNTSSNSTFKTTLSRLPCRSSLLLQTRMRSSSNHECKTRILLFRSVARLWVTNFRSLSLMWEGTACSCAKSQSAVSCASIAHLEMNSKIRCAHSKSIQPLSSTKFWSGTIHTH